MSNNHERLEFSKRLKLALQNANYSKDSPTWLSREFNIRYSGNPVSIHGVRKWLVGEAIPSQEKLRVLSEFLGVSAEWLRFGDNQPNQNVSGDRVDGFDLRLINDLKRMNPHHQKIAREFLRSLVIVSKEMED